VILASPGQNYEARFRIRRTDDDSTGTELIFSINASTGPDGTGVRQTGTETTGFVTFESLIDLETNEGSWGFKRDSIVGKEVTITLPGIEFLQDVTKPNILEIAQKYGPFTKYSDILEPLDVFPGSVMDFLRSLAAIQTATATPVLIPDLTKITESSARAVAEAAALISGQMVLATWDSMAMAENADSEQEVDLKSEYQLLVFQQLVVNVGEQSLLLGTVAKMALSARYEVDGGTVVARPYHNDTLQMWFSPNPDAAGSLSRRVLGRVIGHTHSSEDPNT
jgi:hypothetical protein